MKVNYGWTWSRPLRLTNGALACYSHEKAAVGWEDNRKSKEAVIYAACR